MFMAFSSPTSRESSAWRRPICSIFLLMNACFDPPQDRPSRASLPAWYSCSIRSRKCATSLVCIPLPLSSLVDRYTLSSPLTSSSAMIRFIRAGPSLSAMMRSTLFLYARIENQMPSLHHNPLSYSYTSDIYLQRNAHGQFIQINHTLIPVHVEYAIEYRNKSPKTERF